MAARNTDTLLSATITTAAAGTTTTASVGYDKAKVVGLWINFTYGSGGTSATFYVQTSFDEGTSWVDVACFAFTTASAKRVANLSASTPVTTIYTPTDAALTDNTTKDGVIGDRLRVKYTTVGTYGGSTTILITALARK